MNRIASLDAGIGVSDPETLWTDGERRFCRVWRTDTDGARQPCIAVIPCAEHPPPATVARLVHEYALKEYLDSTWALRPLELIRERGRPMLLLDYRNAEPLDLRIAQPMELAPFLRLAIALTDALTQLHACGLVHKDIKPSNILLEDTTDRLWLTGFGIATRLPRERPLPEPPEHIAGTLSHMAPEQTGRMNRSIDSRSDLYSLGITLYQVLTGSLPFAAADPMAWVHCHIAKLAVPPERRSPNLPRAISAILLRLLAKTPEERYQTAAGVGHDLRRCLTAWEDRGAIDDFALGEADHPHRILVPERLYGRDDAIRTLLTAYDDVITHGTPRLVLVCGSAGIGKSSVVRELQKVLIPPRALFASGKFDRLKSDIPYATLAEAFRSLFRRLLSMPEPELNKWRDGLQRALDRNGALVAALIPELKFVLGEQPPALDIPSPAAKARLQLALRRMIGVFARPEHPLALFLDDLQWLDSATLDLLEELLVQPDLRHLLLVGAYRDTEPDAAHPLMRRVAAIHQAGVSIQTISLETLDHEHVAQLIADALRCDLERAAPLGRLVHAKTAGNPFFVNQFVHSLADEGLIELDSNRTGWEWKLEAIQSKGYTENVVDLMVGKLRRLPLETQKRLQDLACLGHVAEVSILADAQQTSQEVVHAQLFEALRLELIARSDDAYRFAHDRVRESAYSLIPEEEQPRRHLGMGRVLAAQFRQHAHEEAIFEVVNQWNRGSALIAAQEERDELAACNLIAGKRAKAAAAFPSALSYLTAGSNLVRGGWERRRELLFELELHRAECEFLTGAIASAEQRLTALSARAEDLVERAAIACLLADVYVALQRLDRSIAVCLEYVRSAGVKVPLSPTAAQARVAYDEIGAQLGSRSIEELAELPLSTDPVARATLDVLAKIARCALTEMDMDLLCVILCAAIDISLEHGNSDSSCYAYEYFGVIAGWRFGDFEAGARFGRLGQALVERKGLRRHEALVCLTLSIRILPWAAHVRECRALIQRAFDLGNKTGDRVSAVSSRCALISNLLMAGEPLSEVAREAEVGLAFCQRAAFRDFVDAAGTQAAFIRNLRGLTRRFGSLDDERFDEHRMQNHFETQPHARVFECWYWIRKMQARFLAGDHTAALDASLRAQTLMSYSAALLEAAEYELYSALTHAAMCSSVPPEQRRAHLEAMAAHHRQLEHWAEHGRENFESRAVLVAAEIARVEGRELEAMRLYEHAIQSTREHGFVSNEALATELAARFYAARGFDKIAKLYLNDARQGYLRWGADGKARQLDDRPPNFQAPRTPLDLAHTLDTPVEQLDLETVLRVLQAVSGETELGALISTVMRLALPHAGADRGLLILPRGEAYQIEAEAKVDDGEGVGVALRGTLVTAEDLPVSVLQYVLRTNETVVLQDPALDAFHDDEYIRRRRARSMLCMPLLKQARLVGVLYLENTLTRGVFTAARMAVLKLVASEAAISLENARLYFDLREREARMRRLVDSNIVGIVLWHVDGRILDTNDAFARLVGYSHKELVSGRVRWPDLTPPEARDDQARVLAELKAVGATQPHERDFVRKDGSRVPTLVGGAMFDSAPEEGVAFVLDLTERKRAEDALREREHESRQIVDSIPGLIAVLSAAGQVEFVNRQCFDYFGIPFDAHQNWESGTSTHPEDLPRTVEAFRHSIESGEPFDVEVRARRADGVYRWMHSRALPLRDAGGRVVRWYNLLIDIDERKRAEQARAASERSLKLTIDTIPAMAWSAHPDGTAEFFNLHYLDYVGLTAEQASGWGWTDTVHPDDIHGLVSVWQRSMAIGEPGEAEARVRRRDGEYRWFLQRANPLRDEAGNIIKWYGINTDIEDRKRAETELRRAYNSFADAQRLSRTGSFITDLVADDHNWSDEAFRIFEFEPATKVTQQRIRDSIHPDDLPLFDAEVARGMSDGHISYEYRIVTARGAVKHLRGVAHAVEHTAGRPVFVGAVQDVTDSRVAEEALNRARDELAHVARVASLNTLTASIAHEVSQPLSGIITNASAGLRMLDGQPPNVDGARETVKRILRDSNRASKVIARLRDLFSKKEFTLEPLDVNEATREVIALSLRELQRNGVFVQSELAENLPLITGDRVQLQQVILNLFRNATDAMLDVRDRPRRLLIRTSVEADNGVRVSVRDTGVGLERENMENLFEAFYTTKRHGMGIGLSVSRSIIERHQGRLWAESNEGPGATFSFSIPVGPEAGPAVRG